MTEDNPRNLDEARLRPHLRPSKPHLFQPAPHTQTFNGQGMPGDLRGIPVVGARGVGGVSPGTQPERRTVSQHGDWTPRSEEAA